MTWTVAALYRFVSIEDIPTLRQEIFDFCDAQDVCGTLLLAPEGVNGTIAREGEEMDAVIAFLDEKLGVRQGELKFSTANHKPFNRLKIRKKKEIITLRRPEADPNRQVGDYVAAEDWNDLMHDPDVTVIDTRNMYETEVGVFKGAIDPRLENFSDFPDWVEQNLNPKEHKKVAMFCTGGIRCEKASSYMLAQGFEEVYHLKGGILKYLETVPEDQSLWDGECFVFDHRVSVGHGLKEGAWEVCFGCREPLSEEDTQNEGYERGVSCHHCIDVLTEDRAKALRARHAHYQKIYEK